ncbi:hypothetical protein LCGC14_1359130 [marine sediment metagenome]|uniref:Uncharacterized protein n=1 Tax=marine sediment metagenome TaxID=412755 RepID=A0A0F9K991_9ZZZZ
MTDKYTPTSREAAELANLYHLARTALAGEPIRRWDLEQRHARKIWASKQYAADHGIGEGAAYKMLDRALA